MQKLAYEKSAQVYLHGTFSWQSMAQNTANLMRQHITSYRSSQVYSLNYSQHFRFNRFADTKQMTSSRCKEDKKAKIVIKTSKLPSITPHISHVHLF
jgi:hypothetical protein